MEIEGKKERICFVFSGTYASVLIFEHVCLLVFLLVALPCHSFTVSPAFHFVSMNFVHRYGYYCSLVCCVLFVSLLHFDFVGIQRSHVLNIVTRTSKWQTRTTATAFVWCAVVCSRCVTSITEINKRYHAHAFGKCRLIKYLAASLAFVHAPSSAVCSCLLS